MTTHNLKCWPEYFEAVCDGLKKFEVRKRDRDFRPFDILVLHEWNPETEVFSGRKVTCVVSYVLDGGQFGVEPGFVVMSLTGVRES